MDPPAGSHPSSLRLEVGGPADGNRRPARSVLRSPIANCAPSHVLGRDLESRITICAPELPAPTNN